MVNPKKLNLVVKRGTFLGHVFQEGIELDLAKEEAIRELKLPIDVKGMQ